jgi:hypothetical protein
MNGLGTDGTTGLLVGRYRLDERLDSGGIGKLYTAADEDLGRRVAIRMVPAARGAAAETSRQDDAVAALTALNHHSLIGVLDGFVDRSTPSRPLLCLVMELLEVPELQVLLDRGPLAVRDLALLAHDLAEGLQYLHSRGIVHGGLTPATVVLVDYHGDGSRTRGKLTDFGIAQLAEPEPAGADAKAARRARYRGPEQADGAPPSPAGDVFALGQVLLEAVIGAPAGPDRREPDPDREPVPDEWAALIAAMTASDPAERPLVPDLVLAVRQLILGAPGRHRADAPPPLGGPRPAIRPGAPDAPDEEGRMNAVRRYDVLDTPADGAFDRITALAARIFNVPIALVTVVDHDRIWFKSRHGLDAEQIDRDPGLCASAILEYEPWVVTNARVDPRTLTNPLVAGEMGLQFYAGAQLRTHDGHNLGTICVIDVEPREFTVGEAATLHDLAAMVMSELELRLESRRAMLTQRTAVG